MLAFHTTSEPMDTSLLVDYLLNSGPECFGGAEDGVSRESHTYHFPYSPDACSNLRTIGLFHLVFRNHPKKIRYGHIRDHMAVLTARMQRKSPTALSAILPATVS